MNITVTGRHMNVSDSLKDYAGKKITKLDRYFNQLMDAHVILSAEKLDHISEVVINGDGIQFHGKEKAADFFSSIDLLFEKMEKQIRRYKEKHQMHKGPEKGETETINTEVKEKKQIILRQVSDKPVDKVEALLQMRIDKRDFILFKKGVDRIEAAPASSSKNYALIYRDLTGLKMIEVPDDGSGRGTDEEKYLVFDLSVLDESATNPKIEFTINRSSDVANLTLHEAILEIEKSDHRFLPFYNTESQVINVIYRNGDVYEVLVPGF